MPTMGITMTKKGKMVMDKKNLEVVTFGMIQGDSFVARQNYCL
jgi:hypothetical protein